MMPRRLNMRAEPVEPCPTCPEGWRPIGTEHCTDCYEGKIERLTAALKLARGAIEDCHRYRSHIHFDELAEIDRVLDWSRCASAGEETGLLECECPSCGYEFRRRGPSVSRPNGETHEV